MTAPGCLFCRGPIRPWISASRDTRRPALSCHFELFWCDACDLGQLQPRPSQAAVDGFYENYYTHSDATDARDETGFWDTVRRRVAWTFDRGADLDAELIHGLAGGAPARILDVGCGPGRLLAELRDRGHDVAGVEPDPITRALAERRGLTVHAGHADAIPAPLLDGRFDAVVLSHVLHLCLDPLRALDQVRLALRPGGVMICEVTNNEALGLARQRECWRWLDIPRHVTLFTGRSLLRACEAAGLEARRLDYTGYTRQFRRGWLEDEAEKRAILRPGAPGGPLRDALGSWGLLLRTALARPGRKYDSVRVVAERARPPAGARAGRAARA